MDCPANPIGDHNCYHREDVGVRCQEIETTTPITATPAAGELWGVIFMMYRNTAIL